MAGARVLRQWGHRLESSIWILCRCIQVHCCCYSHGYANTNTQAETCTRARMISCPSLDRVYTLNLPSFVYRRRNRRDVWKKISEKKASAIGISLNRIVCWKFACGMGPFLPAPFQVRRYYCCANIVHCIINNENRLVTLAICILMTARLFTVKLI